MGGASSNLRSMLSEEASRVRGDRLAGEPSGLRLSEMLKFEVPDEFAGDVVVPHIATLWVLDRDKDGRFSDEDIHAFADEMGCLLYTSPSPRDGLLSRMPSSA